MEPVLFSYAALHFMMSPNYPPFSYSFQHCTLVKKKTAVHTGPKTEFVEVRMALKGHEPYCRKTVTANKYPYKSASKVL